jgi:CRP-like cAMP-binding protein
MFMSLDNRHADLLVRKLERVFPLSDAERRALASTPMLVANIRPDQDIVRELDRPTQSCIVLEGFACTYKLTGDGRRQITAFFVQGDIPDLQSLHLRMMDSSLCSINECRVESGC